LATGQIVGKNRNTTRSASIFQMTRNYPASDQKSNDIIVGSVEEIAKKHNATNAQIALAWHFTKPYSVSPIIGVSKSEQLYDLVGALDIKLSDEDVKSLEAYYTPRPANFK
jgi:aryl-alcohol dehydrogenase-like predicted oxidoreductase